MKIQKYGQDRWPDHNLISMQIILFNIYIFFLNIVQTNIYSRQKASFMCWKCIFIFILQYCILVFCFINLYASCEFNILLEKIENQTGTILCNVQRCDVEAGFHFLSWFINIKKSSSIY